MNFSKNKLIYLILITILLFSLVKQKSLKAQSSPVPIQVDFSNKIATGSPLIFGGTHTPQWQQIQQLGWDKLKEVGVSFIRTDLSLESFSITSSNFQDPSTWNKGGMQYVANQFLDAKKRGMKTMVIIDYAPPWLTYNNTQYGVPTNWTTWETIVKNAVSYLKNNYGVSFDYYEIWNEPGDEWQDQFFNVTGSGLTKNQAYDLLYLHSWNAIRQVDSTGKIGGPADYQPDSAVKNITYMLNDPQIKDKIDFVSYHYYDVVHRYIIESSQFFGLPAGTNSSVPIQNLLKQLGRTNIPIILSEYNYTCCGRPGSAGTTESVVFDANNFVDLLRFGILGANYFTTSSDLCTVADQFLCFYQIINSQAVLQPEGHIWRLISADLGFGNGSSQIFNTTEGSGIKAIGGINSNNERVIVLVNSNQTEQSVSLSILNSNLPQNQTGNVYMANFGTDPVSSSQTLSFSLSGGTYSANVTIPPQSAVGIKLVTQTPTQSADANNDGKVDGIDYVIWLIHFNQTTTKGALEGDFNGDQKVDQSDYSVWLQNYKLF